MIQPSAQVVVVDASVAVKWLVDEEYFLQARALLADSVADDRAVFAPPILWSEVTNALHQKRRRGVISESDVDVAMTRLMGMRRLRSLRPPGLYEAAARHARENQLRATYDSEYHALCEILNTALWTADQALVRSLKDPRRLRWIGDYASA